MISSKLLESFIIDTIMSFEPVSPDERILRHKALRKMISDLPELHEKSLFGIFYALFQKYQRHYKTSISNPAEPYKKVLLLVDNIKKSQIETIDFYQCADCVRSFKLYNLLTMDESLKCPYCQSTRIYHEMEAPDGLLTAELSENNMRLIEKL